ncbi:BURP domain protein RD22-like [Abrus precatorius]|uniref:BURP domain protein RD22-like n=1 Tax=Abrus precatorius TaxID=3816 RepID=A0A8B8LGA1_ABRPR|nr:BURP domain protein RD22-like [Abrus precatorius]
MEYPLLPIFALLNLAMVATHAALPPEIYWKSVLPNTPMPKAITDFLRSDWVEEKSTTVNDDAGKGNPGGTTVNVGKGGVNVNTGKGGSGTNVIVGGKGGGVSVHAGHKGKPKPVKVDVPPFLYSYAATKTQLHDNPNVALFFLEKDLHPGTKFDLHFTKTSNQATFLPRQVSDSIPFSSNKVEDIFNKLSVKPDSEEAKTMKNTINECEENGIKGEEKYCATSLESMVDFSTSKLGNNVEVVSTEVDKETGLQKYAVTQGVKKFGGDKVVVCHKQNYPYAVFYCHKTVTTRAYSVPLEGAEGIRVKAVAVCHTDTSEWNPKHLAFQVLKVKPGTVPVCHFLPEDHVVWVPK